MVQALPWVPFSCKGTNKERGIFAGFMVREELGA